MVLPQMGCQALLEKRKEHRMIIEPFNTAHLLTITIIPVLIYVVLYIALRGKDYETKRRVLLYICYFNIVLYFVYKVVQYFSPTYEFDFWLNLPLHICNINLFLLPLALLLRNKYLMAFQFYFTVSLSLLALVTVDAAFQGQPILEFTALVYFYYHSFLMVAPVLLVTLKMFRPSFKTVLPAAALMIALTFFAHLVNMALRTSGLAREANYFFTCGLHGDPLTDMYWSLIPYEFFFLIPSLLSFAPFIILTTLPFWWQDRKSAVKRETLMNG
jgi:uncharacterized membrane protein YwaF